MDISLDFYLGTLFSCPHCGTRRPPFSCEDETWFHEDFFRYPTYLHARVPRIECCHQVVATERPWSRSGSRFRQLAGIPGGVGHGLPEDPGPIAGRGAAELQRLTQHPRRRP